jgi:hypothetical protein
MEGSVDDVELGSTLLRWLFRVFVLALVLTTVWNAFGHFVGASHAGTGPVAHCDPETPAWLCRLYLWAIWVQP